MIQVPVLGSRLQAQVIIVEEVKVGKLLAEFESGFGGLRMGWTKPKGAHEKFLSFFTYG